MDHVDGLDFPAAYLERLRALGPEDDLYVVVEKILARGEDLPDRWPVGGTTGYDFLGMADGLAVDPDGVGKIERVYRMVTGTQESFSDLAHRTRREVAEESFAGEFRALADALLPHVRRDPRGRDVTTAQVREALVEVTAAMPVYRTYMCEAPIEERDRRALEVALARARERTDLGGNAWEVVWRVLSLESGPGPLEVCRRWQQLSGPRERRPRPRSTTGRGAGVDRARGVRSRRARRLPGVRGGAAIAGGSGQPAAGGVGAVGGVAA